MAQFLICQQDNYNGYSGLVEQFKNDLKLNFCNDKYLYIEHTEEKDLHIHVILILENDNISKNDLLSIFPYADIQYQRANNKNAYLYLQHKTKKCIKENKTPYAESSIIKNKIDDDFLKSWLELKRFSTKGLEENEILDMICDDILNGEILNFNDILKKYKGVALKYSRSIKEVLTQIY